MIKEFTVKRSEWLRGAGITNTGLYVDPDMNENADTNHCRCCLGFYANACGYKDYELDGMMIPHDLVNDPRLDNFPKELLEPLRQTYADERIIDSIVSANDDLERGEYMEKCLAKDFAKLGITIKFED